MNGGYMVAYLESQGEILCVAGFVIVEKLAWGKTLYIDDLVTDERSRSRGCGKHMISWLKTYAIGTGCYQIHLDSGLSRTDTHRFYEREGFNKASYHFSIIDLHN
jgi:GNAT superfamily N-acetyltransferase